MNYLEIVGTLVGLLYLWFEYKGKHLVVACECHYACHLYSCVLSGGAVCRFGYQCLLFLLAGIYGWWVWLRHVPGRQEKLITFTPRKLFMPLFVVLCLVFALIGGILATYTDSTIPWWDSFTTALSIIAMWMLAHKYVEQWLVDFVVDVISCGLYLYKKIFILLPFLFMDFYAVIAFGGVSKVETINECNRMKEYKLPEQINIPQTIILADGDFPSSSLAKEWLRGVSLCGLL